MGTGSLHQKAEDRGHVVQHQLVVVIESSGFLREQRFRRRIDQGLIDGTEIA
jgi:hypothetical protein